MFLVRAQSPRCRPCCTTSADKPYLAVSLADQPDEDLRIAHGRFLYFSTDEVEPCEAGAEGRA